VAVADYNYLCCLYLTLFIDAGTKYLLDKEYAWVAVKYSSTRKSTVVHLEQPQKMKISNLQQRPKYRKFMVWYTL
jgi:hypothetical protein